MGETEQNESAGKKENSENAQSTGNAESETKQQVIRQLSELIDLVEFQATVGRKSRFGKRPHKGDPDWGYTKEMLATYIIPIDLDRVKSLFAEVGCRNELEAAMWVAVNVEDVP